MKVNKGAIINLDAKPTPGIVIESNQVSFRVYFPSVSGEEPEVLEFKHRAQIDPDELNIIVSRGHQEPSGSTIPEGGEFVLDCNRAVFAVVRIFSVVPFSA